MEEKEAIETEVWVRPPIAKKKSSLSGLPLHLFGSIKSKSSSKRTKSTKSSTSSFSNFSIAHTIPDMPSFIWRETTDETEDEGSMKDSERDDDKHSERGPRMGSSPSTWLEQDSQRGDPGAGPSPTFEEEESWLEEQLSLEQFSPTENEHERRFSQGTGLYSNTSSIPSPRFTPSSAGAQSLRWHQRYESASSARFSGVPGIPAAPLSPLFPEGHEWHQTLNLGESRPSSYVPEPESARIPIGLQLPSTIPPPVTPHMTPRGTPHITPHMTPRPTPRNSQSHIWHQRQGSENSVMQARIESIPQNPASLYQGRTSEDSIRWPSTPQSALQEEALRINQERFPPRLSSRIFPPARKLTRSTPTGQWSTIPTLLRRPRNRARNLTTPLLATKTSPTPTTDRTKTITQGYPQETHITTTIALTAYATEAIGIFDSEEEREGKQNKWITTGHVLCIIITTCELIIQEQFMSNFLFCRKSGEGRSGYKWIGSELLCIYSYDCDDTPCIKSWLLFF